MTSDRGIRGRCILTQACIAYDPYCVRHCLSSNFRHVFSAPRVGLLAMPLDILETHSISLHCGAMGPRTQGGVPPAAQHEDAAR